MKYVPLRDFEIVTDALNFSTSDLHIIGGCELYTIKAAGTDKKLYKNIEESLESQHGTLLRLAASLSPPQRPIDSKSSRRRTPSMAMPEIDLSRDSPFGSFNKISARRTFAYLIATLNASHPDYDFSHMLRPADFQRTSLNTVRRAIDSTLMNMRPRRMSTLLSPARGGLSAGSPQGITSPNSEHLWGEHMWKLMEKEMDFRHCEKYVWEPEDDPFAAESAMWSQHYFFFNKDKKRVCYLNFRAYSVISHSPARAMHTRSMPRAIDNVGVGEGAGKRAQYWLGHSVDGADVGDWDEDAIYEEDEEAMSVDNESNEGEYRSDLDDVRDKLEDGYYPYGPDGAVDDASGWNTGRRASHHRGSSEGPADAMEI